MTPLCDKNIVELRHTVEMVDRLLDLLDAYDPTLILILRPGGSSRLLGYRRWGRESGRRRRRGRESFRRRGRERGLATPDSVIYIVNDVLLALAVHRRYRPRVLPLHANTRARLRIHRSPLDARLGIHRRFAFSVRLRLQTRARLRPYRSPPLRHGICAGPEMTSRRRP